MRLITTLVVIVEPPPFLVKSLVLWCFLFPLRVRDFSVNKTVPRVLSLLKIVYLSPLFDLPHFGCHMPEL